ncbi:MAG: methyltransferase domain-containing protein, partial [Candidatus Omnitrophica bacterium]|nr:methyltransferase domain-containing protein [Candidatus Omnitrophota bacterium]
MTKIFISLLNLSFIFSLIIPAQFVQAQNSIPIPLSAAMITTSKAFTPPLLRGVMINPAEPFRFEFLIDTGSANMEGQALEDESTRLIKYFLASLTVPEQDLWVNLSPFEKQRIIPDQFGITEMGRDLLAQDYLLKQLTAALMYPEKELGHKFWDKIRKEAQARFGTTEIPVNTFNKVWIIPEKAVIFEQGTSAFVVETHLKVMLEQDYIALDKNLSQSSPTKIKNDETDINKLASDIIREVMIPAIEKEVNEGEHFAPLRQIYNSLILATWYKETLKQSLVNQIYSDKNKVVGVDIEDKDAKEKIYAKYIQTFKSGVYNYIKEEYDPVSHEMIPRKYFSGGMKMALKTSQVITKTSNGADFAMLGNAHRVDSYFETSRRLTSHKSTSGELPGMDRDNAMLVNNADNIVAAQKVLAAWFKKKRFINIQYEPFPIFSKLGGGVLYIGEPDPLAILVYEIREDNVFIQIMETDSKYQRKGYATKLVEDFVRRFGDHKLRVEVLYMGTKSGVQESLVGVYEKNGFKDINGTGIYEREAGGSKDNANLSDADDASNIKYTWESYVPNGIVKNPKWSITDDYKLFSSPGMGYDPSFVGEKGVNFWKGYFRENKTLLSKKYNNGLVIGFGAGESELTKVQEEFKVSKISGVDFNDGRVELAAKLLALRKVSPDKVSLYHTDAKEMEEIFDNNSFDFIYTAGISGDYKSASPLIAMQIIRLLQPGGMALIEEGGLEFLEVLRSAGSVTPAMNKDVNSFWKDKYFVFIKSPVSQESNTPDLAMLAGSKDTASLSDADDTSKSKYTWESYVPDGIKADPSWAEDEDYRIFSVSGMGKNFFGSQRRIWEEDEYGNKTPLSEKYNNGLVIGIGDTASELIQAKKEFKISKISGVDWVADRVYRVAKSLADEKARNPEFQMPPEQVSLYHADARDLRKYFKNSSFDFISAQSISLDWDSASPQIAEEIVRLLQPGGVALIVDSNPVLLDVLRKAGSVQELPGGRYFFTKSPVSQESNTSDPAMLGGQKDNANLSDADDTSKTKYTWESFVPKGIIQNPKWAKGEEYNFFTEYNKLVNSRNGNAVEYWKTLELTMKKPNIFQEKFKNALVIGFGDDATELLLLRKAFNISKLSGVDMVGDYVSHAAEQLAKVRFSSLLGPISPNTISLYHADARNLKKNFKANSFDFVYTSRISEDFFGASSKIAREIVRMLKPGGLALITEGNVDFLKVLKDAGSVENNWMYSDYPFYMFIKSEKSNTQTKSVSAKKKDNALLTTAEETAQSVSVHKADNFSDIDDVLTNWYKKDRHLNYLLSKESRQLFVEKDGVVFYAGKLENPDAILLAQRRYRYGTSNFMFIELVESDSTVKGKRLGRELVKYYGEQFGDTNNIGVT